MLLYLNDFLKKYVYPFSAGTDFRRQILTSKVDPRTEKVQLLHCLLTHNIGIQIKQKEPTLAIWGLIRPGSIE